MGRPIGLSRPAPRTRIRFVAGSLVATALALGPVELPSTGTVHADGLPPVAIVVRGKGNGHGRGLSQWGAYGWATKLNATWQDILSFYYSGGGRTIAPFDGGDPALANPGMSVRLETLDGRQTSVISDAATARWSGKDANFAALVAKPVGRDLYDVYGSATAACAAGTTIPSDFVLIGDNVKGPVEFTTPNGTSPDAAVPGDLLGVCEPGGTGSNRRIRYYRGAIRAVNDSKGNVRTANLLSVEMYLRGVVPRESPAGWGSAAGGLGMHALRAQAVAARSYSLSERRYSYAKTCDTQNCQVYGGAALRSVGSTSATVIEDARTNTAIADTAGVVVKDSNGFPVRTEFSSSNGGRTAGGQFPVKADPGDLAADAALQSWTRLLSAAQVQKKFPSVGVLLSVTTNHDGLGGEWGGYATSVVITGTAGTVTRTAWEFRGDFNLNSPWYDTVPVPPAAPESAPTGPILFIGDSVSESIASEFASVVTPAYPAMTYQACAGRGMVGQACLFDVTTPQLDLDGVGVANALPAPAIAVVALGYNDNAAMFDAELQQMIATLTAKGVQRMIFVNLSTRATSRNYDRSNAALVAASLANPAVSVLDWNGASAAPERWRWFDNTSLCCWVHLSTTGQVEFTLFLRDQLDALRSQGLLPLTADAGAVIPGLPLGKGNRGRMVSATQKKLNAVLKLKGTKKLVTDGDFGRATARAVRVFQAKANLAKSGTIDRDTWLALWGGARRDLAVMSVGTRHAAVSALQRSLAKVLRTKIRASGEFDSVLAGHVKTFQKRAGLRQSGKVGPSTWMVLMEAASRSS